MYRNSDIKFYIIALYKKTTDVSVVFLCRMFVACTMGILTVVCITKKTLTQVVDKRLPFIH